MPYIPQLHSGRLQRLEAAFYQGRAYVHWTITISGRATGWLTDYHHLELRELLCHTLCRHDLICPTYSLMPDHAHFLWMGYQERSDQRRAMAALRWSWNRLLKKSGRELERQSYDHILRHEERQRGAFGAVCQYILDNPVRENLVSDWRRYPYFGAMVPGFPILHPSETDFWDRFWRVYEKLTAASGGENLTVSATSA